MARVFDEQEAMLEERAVKAAAESAVEEGQAVAQHAPRRPSDLDDESGFDGAELGEGQAMDIDDESDLDGAEAGERQRIPELLRFQAQAAAERAGQEEATRSFSVSTMPLWWRGCSKGRARAANRPTAIAFANA